LKRGASSFIYPATEANILACAKHIQRGHLVGMPTETVYGLAALALDPAAARKIFELKGRPLVDPLIVHVYAIEQVNALAHVPDVLALLAAEFWPGPLTVVLRKKAIVPDLITAGRPTVAIRIPHHPVARALLHKVGAPVAAPSANPFGYISPTRPEHVVSGFGERLSHILDGGPCAIGLESTILDLTSPNSPALLRPGSISAASLEATLQCPVEEKPIHAPEGESATAPGLFKRHYSPRSPMVLFEENLPEEANGKAACIFLKRPTAPRSKPHSFWFSETGDLEEIGRNLYALLRAVDAEKPVSIYCQVPKGNHGLARAITDRLRRAAAQ
jgi:L-threonylcarbamoyladenylate synthase